MFCLVSLNSNGIRSAATKGFEAWTAGSAADCMGGVQEVKAQADTVAGRFDKVAGMHGHFHFADKPGYSGVGLSTHQEPTGMHPKRGGKTRARKLGLALFYPRAGA